MGLRATRKRAKSFSLTRSEQWHVSPLKDKALDNIDAVFVGSKLMPSAMYHSTIFSEGKKRGDCEYDAVRKFMVHIQAIRGGGG